MIFIAVFDLWCLFYLSGRKIFDSSTRVGRILVDIFIILMERSNIILMTT